ncbi:MAG: biotin/lipoyl-containing protein [Patescibacteria group bacterium]
MAEQKVNTGNPITTTKYVAAIISQTVGTFHTGTSVHAQIRIGDRIGSIAQLGICHDVIADVPGTVVNLLVSDGQPVEFGQPLMLIETAHAPVITNCRVAAPKTAAPADPTLVEVTALLPGTFYAAPAPDAPPYVTPKSHVALDQPVCIIEAMKVFNEILAPVGGTIVEILVSNGSAVLKDQVLFRIKPDGS